MEKKRWRRIERPAFGRTTLQMIAVLTMFCDHFACVFVNAQENEVLYLALRIVGRISFPVFCFVLVQGFLSTKDVRKYMMRILVFAFLSEIPYDLAFSGKVFHLGEQNVLFTLLIGLVVLTGIKRYETNLLAEGMILLAGCILAFFLHTDYSYFGVVLIVCFYILRGNWLSQIFWSSLLIFSAGGIEGYAVLALPLCYWYQPDKQERRLPRYFLYAFYPIHLLVLWGIKKNI